MKKFVHISNINLQESSSLALIQCGLDIAIVLLPVTPVTIAVSVAERLRKRIEASTNQTESGAISITISLGASDLSREQTRKSKEQISLEFIGRADQVLFCPN